ncbi:hypothetical protein [Campylobacter pinnipediorum]|uniref:hypothetical protein n=1 Tax=Campylobacter pinnipediorum TaxID=1965231 RepID=UPI00084DAD19|nr:hypothetical protein [Campylobacter pinnipediorum]AQW80774.1 hypothetical protein CPIN17260_0446 [Campylobacter pinnipediorum subsp. pinnipediorum]AQW83340.1 hypothetical protein CPIN17261_1342 [Campylobacter pinnipediorum subsp. pinnipediorum]OPA75417.1 hypothetical protein BFG05_05965 [Campylobacter pinnipediorum subsp. pinnipediorum]
MIVKIGKKETNLTDKKLGRSIEDFCELKAQIDVLNEKLKDTKEYIAFRANELLSDSDANTISLIVDNDNGVKVSLGQDIVIKDDELLRELLGDKFDMLVKTEVVYKPERKLKELALEDNGLKECLSIKQKAAAVSMLKG